MADSERDAQHRVALQRSRHRWDFWSSYWGFVEADTVDIRRETIHQLELDAGDTVLDLGCGPGVNFEMLREVVGPDGQVLAVDLSRAMLEQAQARIDEQEWENVSLIQGDATAPVVAAEQLDGVVATTAVSATPAIGATVGGLRIATPRWSVRSVRDTPHSRGAIDGAESAHPTILSPVRQLEL